MLKQPITYKIILKYNLNTSQNSLEYVTDILAR